jgi:hypothetical protein
VAQALLGVRSEARQLRLIPQRLPGACPYLPGQSDYNKRLRGALPLLRRIIRALAADTDLWTDPVRRWNLAGFAGYGYCASHPRYFCGLRLHLICTPTGLPISWALPHPSWRNGRC